MPFSTELVRDFVNTFDVETQTDELSSPAELALWLRERDLAGPRPGDRRRPAGRARVA
ncbi:ABATE domain-containing protein [Nonomuraea salmonea]|uniref:ABATE domain-containing protein n=1 Tax=Nonomuraea salmonea TaxID=46181 RepID=UPI0036233667